MDKKSPTPQAFIVSDSKPVLLIAFLSALGMAVLICFAPGPSIGIWFWIGFVIFLILAFATLYRLLISQPALKIDNKGIWFYKAGKLVKWNHFIEAYVQESEGESDSKKHLIVAYLQPNQKENQTLQLHLHGLLNQTGPDILKAIQSFKK